MLTTLRRFSSVIRFQQQEWLEAKKKALLANQEAEAVMREILKTGTNMHVSLRPQVKEISALALQDSIVMGQRQLLGLNLNSVSESIEHEAVAFQELAQGSGAKPAVSNFLSEDARRANGHLILLKRIPVGVVPQVAEAALHQIDQRISELQQVREEILQAMFSKTH